MMLWLKIHTGK